MAITVNERARRIATFRFTEVRLMEVAAAWTPATPEMEVKVVLGKHIWDFAQHADALGKRVFELRQPMHYTLRPVDDYAALLEEVASLESTDEKIAGMYDVLLPRLDVRYGEYVAMTDDLLDAPSVVVIRRIREDLSRQIEEGRAVRDQLEIPHVELRALSSREQAISEMVVAGRSA